MTQHSPQQWFKLEEQFFTEVDNQLLKNLREQLEHQHNAESIMKLTGISDEKLAQEIADLEVTTETLAAFRLVPLVAVAWADDRIQENERYTIKIAAEKSGIAQDSPAMKLLESWINRRPGPELLDAWCDYAKTLAASLNGEHREQLKKEITEQTEAVAEAAGGFLKFGSVSPSEKATMEKIIQALG